MSLPYSASGPLNKRKYSAAEDGDKAGGSGGADPGYLDGPPPAPARRGRLQGQRFNNNNKCYTGRRSNYAVVDEARQNRKPITAAEAKSTFRRIRESTNAYPPLKSVAADLCFILDNCEVWRPSQKLDP